MHTIPFSDTTGQHEIINIYKHIKIMKKVIFKMI
jgi:hypothetical protein